MNTRLSDGSRFKALQDGVYLVHPSGGARLIPDVAAHARRNMRPPQPGPDEELVSDDTDLSEDEA